MKFQEALRWKTRMSAVYGLGIWTVIGSVGYFYYTGRTQVDSPEQTELEKDKKNLNATTYENAYIKTVITRKENFVPFTTRIYTYFTSLKGETKSEK